MTQRSITVEDIIELLASLFRVHGEPTYLRSDNGPEFIAAAVKKWLDKSGVKTLYIEPGSPWQNGYSESFNSRFEDELLNRETFTSLTEAKVLVENYRVEYNHERPHSSLGVPHAGGVRRLVQATQRGLCFRRRSRPRASSEGGKIGHQTGTCTLIRPGTENGVLTSRLRS